MKTKFTLLTLATALAEIKVSYQPALYWALPFIVATEKNWFGWRAGTPARCCSSPTRLKKRCTWPTASW